MIENIFTTNVKIIEEVEEFINIDENEGYDDRRIHGKTRKKKKKFKIIFSKYLCIKCNEITFIYVFKKHD